MSKDRCKILKMIQKGLIAIGLVVSLAGCGSSTTASPLSGYETIGMDTYQSWVKNWDSTKTPVLYALVQDATQWDTLLQPVPAAIRPAVPDPALFTNNEIVIVSRTMPAPIAEDWNRIFEVDHISTIDGKLTVSYIFHKPQTGATWDAKIHFGVVVPRAAYNTVAVIENGTLVGELDVAKGQWCVPVPQ